MKKKKELYHLLAHHLLFHCAGIGKGVLIDWHFIPNFTMYQKSKRR